MSRLNLARESGASVAVSTTEATTSSAKAVDGLRGSASGYSTSFYWRSDSGTAGPHWLEITFAGTRTVKEIYLASLPDSVSQTVPVGPADTGTLYRPTDYKIQTWNGTTWDDQVTVTGNNKLFNKHVLSSTVDTTKLRVYCTASPATNNGLYITELEVYNEQTNPIVKTTGLAAEAISILAVDLNTGAIRDFLDDYVTSGLSAPGVTYSTGSWKSVTRPLFNTNVGQQVAYSVGKQPLFHQDGQFGFFSAVNDISGASQYGSIITESAGATGMTKIDATGHLQFVFGLTNTVLLDTGAACSIAFNQDYGVASSFSGGPESGALAVQTSASTASYFGYNPYLGGVFNLIAAEVYVVASFRRPLTLVEQQSLHNDWFGTLFTAGVSPPAPPPPPVTLDLGLSGPSSGTTGVASSAFTVSITGGTFSGTITPHTSASGTFSPTTLSGAGTFTYTPSTSTTALITLTNTGGATNPTALPYASAAASPPPAPTPPPPISGIPSFVPPKPTTANTALFCDLEVANMPGDVSGMYGTGYREVFDHYVGTAAYIEEDATLVHRGSGHDPNGVNVQGSFCLHLNDTRGLSSWALKNVPPGGVPNVDPGNPGDRPELTAIGFYNDGTGYMFADGTGFAPHPYTQMDYWPSTWNGGPLGNGHPGVIWRAGGTLIAADIRSDVHGYTKVINNLDYGGNSAPQTAGVAWKAGQGWFSHIDNNYANHTVFVRANGTQDTSYPAVNGNYSQTALVLDEAHQHLIGINGGDYLLYGAPNPSVKALNIVDLATKVLYTVHYTGPGIDDSLHTQNAMNRGSWKWVTERDAAVGINIVQTDFFDLMALVPPAANRLTTNWATVRITSSLWSGAPVGSATSLQQNYSSSSQWVALNWIPKWDCFIYTPHPDARPQLIRVSDLSATATPPGPPPPTPPSPPPPITPIPTPPASTRKVRALLSTSAAGATGVTAQFFTKTTAGRGNPELFSVGFAGESYSTATLTMPAASAGLVTIDVDVPYNVGVTVGQVVKGVFGNSTNGSIAMIDCTVI